MGDMRNTYKIQVRKPEGKRLLGRLRCRWEDNIIFYLGELIWIVVKWIHLAHDRDRWRDLVNTATNFGVP
jgi:hypothetical protein